jgi:hypothetical protein
MTTEEWYEVDEPIAWWQEIDRDTLTDRERLIFDSAYISGSVWGIDFGRRQVRVENETRAQRLEWLARRQQALELERQHAKRLVAMVTTTAPASERGIPRQNAGATPDGSARLLHFPLRGNGRLT